MEDCSSCAVVIGGQRFVPAEKAQPGKRAVVVVDRGWIFAGDVGVQEGRIILTRAVHVQGWDSIGFHGILENSKNPKIRLKKLPVPVDIPASSEIFRCPVPDDWGL